MIEWVKKAIFVKGLTNPTFFRRVVRPLAYKLSQGDPEKVHEMALTALNEFEESVREVASYFDFPYLKVSFAGKQVTPFGTAAGFDKNGDVLSPLSYIFGFQEVGTVIVNPREGNPRPRVAIDSKNGDLYNAQGFPSKGLDYFLKNIRTYREKGGDGFILVSVCGLPPSSDRLDISREELSTLVDSINPYVEGFVWNPFSPNTAALSALRATEEFGRAASLIAQKTSGKPLLVKMGPYDADQEKRDNWLDLVDAWLKNGGTGLVAVNTYMTPKEKVPSETWGYPSAGRSGRFLQSYRDRAVKDARKVFPDATIIATGGIDTGEQAWNAFKSGADLLEGYTPYTFNGLGLLHDLACAVDTTLDMLGYKGRYEEGTGRQITSRLQEFFDFGRSKP